MIDTSAEYKDAVLAPSRHLQPKVDVYFDGDNSAPTSFEGDVVSSITFLEEARTESDSPLGLVSSNEVTITFKNEDRVFSPNNTSSPYHGRLLPNILVEPYLGLYVLLEEGEGEEEDVYGFEYVPLGKFRTSDWIAASNDIFATVTCYDKLRQLEDIPIPSLPVQHDTTVGEMFETLFQAMELEPEDYVIDDTISAPISLGWFPEGRFLRCIQQLAIAGNCSVTVNREGAIRVRSNFQMAEAVVSWNEEDAVLDVDSPQTYLNTYSSVTTKYHRPFLGPIEEVLQIDTITVPAGGMVLDDLSFSRSPVGRVRQIVITGGSDITADVTEIGAHSLRLEIDNPGARQAIGIIVYGQIVDTVKSSHNIISESLQDIIGHKDLTIDNYLIQDYDAAKDYATLTLQVLSNPAPEVTANVRGDPSVEIGDVITIEDETHLLDTVDILPSRITLDYAGGLRGTVTGIKTELLEIHDWVYMGPGLYAKVLREVT